MANGAVRRNGVVRRAHRMLRFVVRRQRADGARVVARRVEQRPEGGEHQQRNEARCDAVPGGRDHEIQISIRPVIPVCDVIPWRNAPAAVIGLLALHAVAFAAQLNLGPAERQALVDAYGVTPPAFSLQTIATGMWLHAGWVHLGVNLLYLWLFGASVEPALGRAAFVLLYVSCAACGAAAYVAASPSSGLPLVGSSSAVAGVIGAYLVLYPRSRVLTAVLSVPLRVVEVPAVFFAGLWFVLQLLSGVGDLGVVAADGAQGVAAHLAGLAAGGVCGAYFRFGAGSLRRYWAPAARARRAVAERERAGVGPREHE